jgi:DNA/RNA endonuclease YhcR with UshA esterase domain
MRTPRSLLILAAAASLLRPLPARAHHSFAAEYDANAAVAVKGVVTKIEWTNPHAYVYIDVTDEGGKVVNWAFEGYPPNTLKRTGFPRDLLKSGDVISITGYRARYSQNRAAGREITLADGRKVFLGPAA